MQELQVEFEKLDASGTDKPRPTRFLRSQQDLREKYAQIDQGATTDVGPGIDEMNGDSKTDPIEMIRLFFYYLISVQEDLDPFELIEPVNILERLSKEFYQKLVRRSFIFTRFDEFLFVFFIVGIKTMERSKRSVGRSFESSRTESTSHVRYRLQRIHQESQEGFRLVFCFVSSFFVHPFRLDHCQR